MSKQAAYKFEMCVRMARQCSRDSWQHALSDRQRAEYRRCSREAIADAREWRKELSKRPQVAQRDPDGALIYRGLRIVTNPNIRPDKLGRYSVEGVPFAQLAPAKAYIDTVHRLNLVELDPLV